MEFAKGFPSLYSGAGVGVVTFTAALIVGCPVVLVMLSPFAAVGGKVVGVDVIFVGLDEAPVSGPSVVEFTVGPGVGGSVEGGIVSDAAGDVLDDDVGGIVVAFVVGGSVVMIEVGGTVVSDVMFIVDSR